MGHSRESVRTKPARRNGGPSDQELVALVRNASSNVTPWPTISVWHGSARSDQSQELRGNHGAACRILAKAQFGVFEPRSRETAELTFEQKK